MAPPLLPRVARSSFCVDTAAPHPATPPTWPPPLSAAAGRFCAGFDINQFQGGGGGGGIDDRINESFCALIESGPKPTVAAVSGMALGGGCELALACNARVATPGTALGLPELQLGIIPGFGGTQRLPRAVGLQKAVEMMLTSAPIKAGPAALKAGIVDAVVPPEQLMQAARRMALDMAGVCVWGGGGGGGGWRVVCTGGGCG